MADRTTPEPAGGERPIGEEPEVQAASADPEDLESLRSQVTAAEQQRDEYLALLQRTRADFENYQKRMQRDREQERRYAPGPLAAELLPALDNLERATAAAKQAGETGPLVQGVAMVQTQLLDVLRRHGITGRERLVLVDRGDGGVDVGRRGGDRAQLAVGALQDGFDVRHGWRGACYSPRKHGSTERFAPIFRGGIIGRVL